MEALISVNDFSKPQVLVAEKDYLVVFKPPKMHSVPLAKSPANNLLKWSIAEYPEIADLTVNYDSPNNEVAAGIPGRNPGEGGVLHRLDYETQGLIIIARTKTGMFSLIEQQKNGKIIKEYSALTGEHETELPGFPEEKPILHFWVFRDKHRIGDSVSIKSAFRPYGPGRKAVRPILPKINVPYGNTLAIKNHEKDIALDGSRPYVTEVMSAQLYSSSGEALSVAHDLPNVEGKVLASFRIKIARGFRHQLRSHFAWIGRPILNDSVYGGLPYGKGLLGLRACSVSFNDPATGKTHTFSIPPITLEEI